LKSAPKPPQTRFHGGADPASWRAAARLKADGFLTTVLVGAADDVKAAAQNGGFDIDGIEILDPPLRRHDSHGREDGGAPQGLK
jgi:phosphotransacetylase